MWIIGVSHALRLRYIDLLRKMLIEEGIDIKLANAPLAIECNAKHSTNGDGIYHGTESLVKINVRLLVKALSNNASFILCNRAFGILFNVKHLFVAHYILPRSRGNYSPSIIPDESIIFFLHCMNPLGIQESLSNNAGFNDRWNDGGEAIFCVGFKDYIFRASLHEMKVKWGRGRGTG